MQRDLMRKTRRFGLALMAVFATLGWASPAQDLFDQASFYLEFYYYGPASADLHALTAKYQKSLDAACANQKESCPYDTAVGVIQRMVSELGDGHTYYQSPEALGRFRQTGRGQVPSGGLRIGVEHRSIPGSRDRLVVDVVEGSPADQAGLQYGDRIVALNGKALGEYASDDEVAQALSQLVQSGQPVRLTVLRGPQRQKLEVVVTGREINLARLPSLKMRPDGVAVLRIPDFLAEGQVGQRVHELVQQAQAAGARAMLLDLRGNSGGSAVEALISMAAFVDNPYVLFTDRYDVERNELVVQDGRITARDKSGAEVLRLSIPNPARWRGPLAVLVNGESASGAEYLASAIQFAKAGVVVGEPTAGVGNTTTRTFGLINGGGLNISYNRAFLPGGNPYPARVTPDIAAPDDLRALAETGHDLPTEKALVALLPRTQGGGF
ncbi:MULTISPECIES: S41 family peptidase [unclassified Meiothermus]|uniref:S41 family peptidase n=1 Tax=unclassified Meiothermus TaxID=370471 RepID=UPI000D7C0B9B|nr:MULTISPECIES: S41 family peptidase [unclassified Meiothermus]PZA06856.1 peptidase S41 [Meiothermus sp. Pnk-1]RYM33178.1 PDZ domain-containing protein [Meiothermus sp. PNK-Is4]